MIQGKAVNAGVTAAIGDVNEGCCKFYDYVFGGGYPSRVDDASSGYRGFCNNGAANGSCCTAGRKGEAACAAGGQFSKANAARTIDLDLCRCRHIGDKIQCKG